VPWRSLAAEAVLEGQVPSDAVSEQAAAAAFAVAQPLANNDYKVEIGRALVARAIRAAYSV
jgi:xanthine dehydrogenase YagS FAD-binding subunit